MAAKTLPVRPVPGNVNGERWKVNEEATVVHCVQGDRLCCLPCRSNTCEHVQAVEAYLTDRVFGSAA